MVSLVTSVIVLAESHDPHDLLDFMDSVQREVLLWLRQQQGMSEVQAITADGISG